MKIFVQRKIYAQNCSKIFVRKNISLKKVKYFWNVLEEKIGLIKNRLEKKFIFKKNRLGKSLLTKNNWFEI
jgi:hypothetical protein